MPINRERSDCIAHSLKRTPVDYLVLILLLAMMVGSAYIGLYIIVPVGLAVFFVYEAYRSNRPGAAWLNPPSIIWWLVLGIVLVVLGALLFSLSSGSLQLQSGVSTSTMTTIPGHTTATSTATTSAPTSSSSTTTAGTTSTIQYKTQSATAATAGYGQGSIFLPGNYRKYICGGTSTSTTGVSWSPNVSVSGYSSIGINANGTCTLQNGNVNGRFNSYYAVIAGIALNARNYTLVDGVNLTQMLFNVNQQNSFVVAIVTGNTHSFGPYLFPEPVVSYPPNAAFNCNVTEQQTSTAVRENATSFVKSTISLIVCPSAAAGSYLLSEKNLTDSSFAVYIFKPR
ncbi:MAG: hypothetical protein M1286_02390 [Candidatus Marsarchaeota archaeon]|nr:hypothetical protein [Candidatus Marsarchaeota archaeon]